MKQISFNPDELQKFIASLAANHDDLAARLRVLTHSVKSQDANVQIHAHYFPFRGGKPTVGEFIEILASKLVRFCLPGKSINETQKKWKGLSRDKVMESAIALHNKAVDLFKRANKATNRNGEFGEVITFLLIESVLRAPQLVAKMSLKTSPQMPVHGSDGIHFKFDASAGNLRLFWGESKCYGSVSQALAEAVTSVADNLKHGKMSHELFLIEQHADMTEFPNEFREAVLSFLDPYDDNYNKRVDTSVILIVFDFDAFAKMNALTASQVEGAFCAALAQELENCVQRLDTQLQKHGVSQHSIEVFFLPAPSVGEMRTLFQNRIGWTT